MVLRAEGAGAWFGRGALNRAGKFHKLGCFVRERARIRAGFGGIVIIGIKVRVSGFQGPREAIWCGIFGT